MSAETESDLVERCRAGDQDAFRELLEHFHARVFAVAYALTRDGAEAAEVEQETFIKAWRGLAHFRGDAALGTWLTRLAVNTSRDRLRRIRTRTLLAVLMPWRTPTGQEAFERLEQRDELEVAQQCGWDPSLSSRAPGEAMLQVRCAARLASGVVDEHGGSGVSELSWREAAQHLGIAPASGPAADRRVYLVELDVSEQGGSVVVVDVQTAQPYFVGRLKPAPTP